ncbi:uncharacterized protein LOC126678089 [Mercurialis annua]|uniref:uncharacterized protein LOC126678089 n=1 Tax=Mercurialis annua TaxID=3986 RepID=UPI00215DF06D|nr:uncharacterized protein LOC126678089 [Mercurialis annua]
MTDHHHHHHHRIATIQNLRTTSHLLKTSIVSFTNNFFTFFLLSLLLFSFRSLVENGTHSLTTFIDRDPSLKSLLSRLDLAGNRHHSNNNHLPPRRLHHRRAFLHLTRVGTLDDDFFSGDDDTDRSFFNPNRKLSPNGSSVILYNFDHKLGFSDFISDNGVNAHETVRSGVQFKFDGSIGGGSNDLYDNNEEESERGSENAEDLESKIVDFEFFIKGLEIGRRDAAALFLLISFLSAAYGWVILGFTAIYSWILGIVFVAVVYEFLGRFHHSFVGVIWDGSKLGLKRLTGFILMKWAVRDALTQLIGLWYFGEIEDQYSFFKLFVRLKLMPFSIMSPWILGFEKEISGFLFTWFLSDAFVAFIFAVDAWVTIVDSRRTGREIVREGCYLISTMFNQAVQLKSMESILCGSAARWVLSRVLGKFLAAVLQSTLEVYFMIAWLIFYLAARSKDANSEGRRFGRRELEGLIDGLR